MLAAAVTDPAELCLAWVWILRSHCPHGTLQLLSHYAFYADLLPRLVRAHTATTSKTALFETLDSPGAAVG